MKLYRCIFIW